MDARSVKSGILLFVIFILTTIPHAKAQVLGLELLNGKDNIEIDFEYSAGFILLDIKFSRTLPLRFILDTGAEHVILFKKEITDILGLKYEKRINLIGSDLEKEVFAYITRNVPLYLENSKTVERDIIVLEEDFLHLEELTGEAIHGILGSRFFRGLVMEVDYRKEKLILHDGSKFRDPSDEFRRIPIKVSNHKPYVDSKIIQSVEDTIDLNLLIDTGAALPFLLFLNTHTSLQIPENFIKGNLGKGLGGDLEGYLSKVNSLHFTEHFVFNDLITSFQEVDENLDPAVYQYRNGLIGNPILERFHFILDFVNNIMYLRPNKNFKKEFKYDKSGLIIYAFGPDLSSFYVKDVIKDSPAYEAGIRKGDMIKRIGIWPAHFYSLGNITNKLQSKVGKKIKMVLERNGVRYKTQFILKDILQAQKSSNN